MKHPLGHIQHLSPRALVLLLFLFSALPAGAGIPISEDACRRLSEGAKITGTKALIIGYEGLFSSSPINANLLATYREKLATGQKARRPLYLFGGSFLTRGPLTRVVENYKNRVQVLLFGRHQTSASSIPGKCATIWMQDKGVGTEGRKVIIVGHSFGGAAAYKLAKSLRVKVDAVVTADPRDPVCMGECFPGTKPSNVAVWSNIYQGTPLRGHPVTGAQNHFHTGYSHGTIQNAPAFYRAIANRIDGVSGPLTVAAPTHTGERAGRTGDFNPSSISGLASAAGSKDNPIPESGQAAQGAAPAVPAGSNPILRALSSASPARSRATEEAWFNRASGFESTGGSATAKKVELGDGVVRYYKPGGGPPEKTSRLNLSGASLPGSSAPADGNQGTAVGADGSLSDSASRAGSSSTAMLNKMWPLSKGEAALPAAGGGYNFGSSSSSSSSGSMPDPGTKDLFALDDGGKGPDVSALGPDAEAVTGEGPASGLQAATGDLATSSTSLFRRVHLKHVNWFKRRDRF